MKVQYFLGLGFFALSSNALPNLTPAIERLVQDKLIVVKPTRLQRPPTLELPPPLPLHPQTPQPPSSSSIPQTLSNFTPGSDGNLFVSLPSDSDAIAPLTPGTSQFAYDPSTFTILTDASNDTRLLYYHPDEMSAFTVSRLRLGAWGAIPKGAQLIGLTPFDDGNGNEVLVGLDTSGNYYWPILCGLDGLVNKVFLAQDVTTGAAALMANGDLRYTITGGSVTDCGPLALVAQGASGSYS